MPSMVTNYKCPSCLGPLHFVGESGKLECEYCGSQFTVKEIEQLQAGAEASAQNAFAQAEAKEQERDSVQGDEGEWDASGLEENWGADAAGMRAYNCPSCGAELIYDQNTAATCCPYCGNPTVVPGQFSGTLKPDYILPFRLDKNAALDALKKHYGGKPFLPKSFMEQNHIEKIQGVYVPFWLFDGRAEAKAAYKCTRTRSYRQGDYEVTVTSHYNVRREGTIDFEKVPADASSRMPDNHMDSIEPYDFSGLTAFSTAYLPGFLADKYDVDAQECAKRADERCRRTALNALSGTVMGYETVSAASENVRLRRGKVHYALLPVWMLSTRWNGQNFLFAMNGQTGKIVGDLPVDKGRYWTRFAVIALPVAAAVAALLTFLL